MICRICYFLLGVAASVIACALLLSWDARQDYKAKKHLLDWTDKVVNPPLRFDAADLVGRWRGRESWGNTFVIVRKPDGTFTRTMDSSKSDVRHRPFMTKKSGFWSLRNSSYVESPTTGGSPEITIITPRSSTEFEYKVSEGDYVTEVKE